MTEIEKRFVFTGHAIGAGGHFHRLDNVTGLNHLIPALGASVLPATGGLSESKVANYCFTVDHPVRRRLLSVRNVDTRAHGYLNRALYHTDVETTVEHITWLDRVHFDLLALKMETTHKWEDPCPTILIKKLKIEGVQLGSVTAHIEYDDEPFASCGTKQSLEDFWASKSDRYRQENAARFHTEPGNPAKLRLFRGRSYICSVVRKITLSGPEHELKQMRVDGHTIIWEDPDDPTVGFGKIILGEVLVNENDRRIMLARLEMGSPSGGSGGSGEGHSNGTTMP